MIAFAAVILLASAGAPPSPCAKAPLELWGDGAHDDTAALNAWFRGENVVWADTSSPVGSAIVGRTFRLSDAIYIQAGTGLTFAGFQMIWPERHETVSGGTIATGSDPDAAPLETGITRVGGDADEGVPFDTPETPRHDPEAAAKCLVS